MDTTLKQKNVTGITLEKSRFYFFSPLYLIHTFQFLCFKTSDSQINIFGAPILNQSQNSNWVS